VYITLVEGVADTGKEFDDIKLKLDTLTDLPQGAGPINFIKDFGDTAALMLTVASPKVSEAGIEIRARTVRRAIEDARAAADPSAGQTRVTVVQGLPAAVPLELVRRPLRLFADAAMADGVLRDARVLIGAGYVAVDAASEADEATVLQFVDRFIHERLRVSEFHPDSWPAVIVRNPADTRARLSTSAGDKYTYKELDDYTDLLVRSLKTLPMVSKVTRAGLLDERVYLEYSHERLASYGVKVGVLDEVIGARNITLPGGLLEVGEKNLTVDPSGEFKSEGEIGDVLVPTASGRQVYLRDLVTIGREYESPAPFYNFFSRRDEDGSWRRARAVTLAIQMRAGQKIGEFGEAVDAKLAEVRTQLPDDLLCATTGVRRGLPFDCARTPTRPICPG
jgi:AcrB/AcrD/AcrF family